MNEYKIFSYRIGLVGIIKILILLSGLIFIPIITKNFSIADYGIWVQVSTTITLLPKIASLGLPYAMARFLSVKNTKLSIKNHFYSMLVVVFATSISICLVFVAFQKPIGNYLFEGNLNVVYLVAFISFFACMNLMFINFFRTFQQIKKYSIFLFLETYIGFTISSYLALSGHNIENVIFGLFIGYLAVFIIMVFIIVRDLGLYNPCFDNIKEQLFFAIPTIPSNLSSWVVDGIDKYIIWIFLGSSAAGYYSTSFVLGSIIFVFLAPFTVLLPAVLPKYFEEGNLKQVKKFLKYSMKYFLIIAIPSAVGLSILSKSILMIISTPEIAINGYLVTFFVCLGALFIGIYEIISNILLLERKTMLLGKIWVFVIVLNFIFTISLVSFIGIIGVALVALICYFIALSFTAYYCQNYLKFSFDASFMKIIMASAIMGLFVYIHNPVGISDVLITILFAIVIYFGILFLIKGIKKEEYEFFKTMISVKN